MQITQKERISLAQAFFIPKLILSGTNALELLGARVGACGKRALIVTGRHVRQLEAFHRLEALLAAQQVDYAVFDGITGEPDDTMIAAGAQAYRDTGCDFLIAMGGGSPIDSMKAIAVTAASGRNVCDYYGRIIDLPLPPMIAIPTTAGTGSEATQFTVITDTARNIKMLLKGACLLPDIAVVDGALGADAPKSVTASTGLDALTHAVEAYTSRRAQPLTDALCVSAVTRIFRWLPVAYRSAAAGAVPAEEAARARSEMASAALEAGIAINNSSVTIVHGMSRPIGALYHVPHGLSNAMLLPRCMAFAAGVADPAQADPEAQARFAALGRAVGAAAGSDSDAAAAAAFVRALGELCTVCEVPTLAQYGIDRADFLAHAEKMAADALASGSPANTRRTVTADDELRIYRALFD